MAHYVSTKATVTDLLGDIANLLGDITEGPKRTGNMFDSDLNATLQLDLQLNSFFKHLQALKRRRDEPLSLAVLALTKSGKSTLINSLLSSETLPMNNVPETARIVRILHNPSSPISMEEGGTQHKGATAVRHRLRELNDAVRCHDPCTPQGSLSRYHSLSPGAASMATSYIGSTPAAEEMLHIEAPITALSELESSGGAVEGAPKICLLDTPGPNEAGEERLKHQVEAILDNVDAVLYVLDYTRLKTQEEEQMLHRLKAINPRLLQRLSQRLFFVVNKVDSVHVSQGLGFEETREYVADLVTRQLGCEGFRLDPRQVILTSARNALLSRLVLSERATERSMRHFLTLAFGYSATSYSATQLTQHGGINIDGGGGMDRAFKGISRRAAARTPTPISPELVVQAAQAMLADSGIEDLEDQVLGFLHSHGGGVKLMALVDDVASLVQGISSVASSCHASLHHKQLIREREGSVLKEQLQANLKSFDEVLRDMDEVGELVTTETRAHLDTLRRRLLNQVLQVLDIDLASVVAAQNASTASAYGCTAQNASTASAYGCTARGGLPPGQDQNGWERLRTKILSIFTSTSGHSPDEAASQAVARSRSQDEMTRLLTELHHELLSQIQIDVSEFQQVLEACTNACLSHHLASINNKLAPLLRSFEGAGEPSLEAHLIPCKDVSMRLPEATDFSSDLQQLAARSIRESRHKHIRVTERQYEERVMRHGDGFYKWATYWETVPRTRTVVETYVTTMYELHPEELSSHFLQVIDHAIGSAERILGSYVVAFMHHHIGGVQLQVQKYSEQTTASLSSALESSGHGAEYRQAAVNQLQGYMNQAQAITAKLEMLQKEAELQVPHAPVDMMNFEDMDMGGHAYSDTMEPAIPDIDAVEVQSATLSDTMEPAIPSIDAVEVQIGTQPATPPVDMLYPPQGLTTWLSQPRVAEDVADMLSQPGVAEDVGDRLSTQLGIAEGGADKMSTLAGRVSSSTSSSTEQVLDVAVGIDSQGEEGGGRQNLMGGGGIDHQGEEGGGGRNCMGGGAMDRQGEEEGRRNLMGGGGQDRGSARKTAMAKMITPIAAAAAREALSAAAEVTIILDNTLTTRLSPFSNNNGIPAAIKPAVAIDFPFVINSTAPVSINPATNTNSRSSRGGEPFNYSTEFAMVMSTSSLPHEEGSSCEGEEWMLVQEEGKSL